MPRKKPNDISDRRLLRLVYEQIDLPSLCRRHPAVTRDRVVALFMRLVEMLGEGDEPEEVPPPAPQPEHRAETLGELLVYTDGAAKGNPGPAGIGYVIAAADGETLIERGRHIGKATNNEAEYEAVLAALEEALALGGRRVTLRSDSELVVKQLNGEYRIRNPRMRALCDRVRALADQLEAFVCEAVPREDNAGADRLASEAAKGRF